MKLGIKVSVNNYSIRDIETARPPLAEVWFNIRRAMEYKELFSTLKRCNVETGLHFWGTLADGTMANLAYPDAKLNAQSIALIKESIDIAADNGFVYVNSHPGSHAVVRVDFEKMDYPYVSKPVPLAPAIDQFIEHAKLITDYAITRGVVFTVETVSQFSPKSDWYNPMSRKTPFRIYDLPLIALEKAAINGIAIANDFVHTATHCISDNPEEVWSFVLKKTKTLAQSTKLIHLGFMVPPYNGVDNHDMLDNPVFETRDAVPNHTQMRKLFSLFADRKDVWVITEPKKDHAKNYVLAKKLLSEVQQK